MTRVKINPYYEVDEEGNVYSVRKNKKLTSKTNWDGYLRIQLWDHGVCQFVSIHRLVAQAFIPNPENKPFVNHKNGCKSDNRVANLEWCTQKENIKHAFDTGLSHKCPKNFAATSKSVAQFTVDGEYIRTFPSTMEVERQLGIAHTNVSACCKGKVKTAGHYKWKYVEPVSTNCTPSTGTMGETGEARKG